MKILPQVQAVLTYAHSVDVTHIKDRLQASRESYERLNPLAGEPETVFSVEDRVIRYPDRNVPIRIYLPNDKKDLPAVVYFHGGGFFKGSLESHDRPLRQLSNLSGAVIISVGYRLAPEYPYPQGLNDCVDTTKWIMNHATELGIERESIAIAGDSAGGTLATAVAGKATGAMCQILIYPATDSSLSTPSWSTFADGPILTLKSAVELWDYYTKDPKDRVRASPLSNDDVSGMPDTFILTGEYDPLIDEIAAYAEKLRRANVRVTEKVYPKMIHGFFQFGGVIDEGREAIADIARYIKSKAVQ